MPSCSNRPPAARSSVQAMLGLISFDRRAMVPTLSILLAATLVSAISAIAVAGPQMVSAQLERAAARQPIGPGRDADPNEASAWRWELPIDGRTLTWFFVRLPEAGVAPPPGVRSWPRAGGSVGSPAVAELARSEPALAAAFPPLEGLLTRDGLQRPDELVVWTRLDLVAKDPGPALESFGSRVFLPEYLGRSLRPLYFAMVGLLVVVPLVVLAGAGSRAAERARRARSRALDLVGAPVWLGRGCVAVEVGMPALVGSVLGVAFSGLLWWWAERRGWAYAQDLRLTAVATSAIVIGVATTMGAVASLALASSKPKRIRSRSAQLAVMAGLTVAGLVWWFQRVDSQTLRFAIWPVTVLGVGLVLVFGAEGAVELLARSFASISRRPTWLAAFRQLEASPRAVTSVYSTMATLTVAVIGLGPLAGVFFDQASTARGASEIRSSYPAVTAYADVAPTDVAQLTSIRGVVGLDNTTGEVRADCLDMRSLLNERALPCEGLSSWVVANDYSRLPGLGPNTADETGGLPRVQLATAPLEQSSYVVVSRSSDQQSPQGMSSLIGLDTSQSALDLFRVEYAREFPSRLPARVALDGYLIGQQSMAFVPTFIFAVTVVGILASALATLILLVPMAEDRRPLQHSWRIIGAPNRFLYGSQVLFYSLPAFGMIAVGGLSMLAIVSRYTRLMGLGPFTSTRYNSVLLASVILSGLVSISGTLLTCKASESTERIAQ